MKEEAGTFAEQGGAVVVLKVEDPLEVFPKVAAELVEKRKEAIEGRQQSGIESRWKYAENAYNSIDEATEGVSDVLKPSAPGAPFISGQKSSSSWKRSTAFMNITRPYVDASASRVADMLFAEDERNWELRPTPKLEVEDLEEMIEKLPPEQAQEAMDLLAEQISEALDSVEDAQKQIDDWLTEGEWNSVGRQIIWDAARVGTGVVKGPVPMLVGGKLQPSVKVVKVQNCFPDPACGQDVHDGEYFFEREMMVARKFREKLKMEDAGWILASVRACLEEGPKYFTETRVKNKEYELWHFQGEVPVELLLECGCKVDDSSKRVWANVTLCNDSIVRVSVMPLQERFSYNVLPWQKRNNHWAGIGVAEQIETPQRGLNAAVRNLFDNSALTALPQIIHWRGVITPLNGVYELAPGKQWEVAGDDVQVSDVKNAIMTIEIPSRQSELMSIVDLMRNIAQEVTGLPLIMMGQGSTGAVGSDQLQTNAATTVLRRLAKLFDEKVTRPLVLSFYKWIREYDVLEVPEAMVEPKGSSVLVERDIQAQALAQMVQLSKDPTYGMDPKLVAEEWMRSQKFDPKRVRLSEEREQQLMEAMSAPDEKAQAQVESAQLRAEALTKQAQMEAESDRIATEAKAASEERDRQHDQVMLDLKYKYELIKYAMERKIDIGTAMEELNAVKSPKISAPAQVIPPPAPVESAGQGAVTPPLTAPNAGGGLTPEVPPENPPSEELPDIQIPSVVEEENA